MMSKCTSWTELIRQLEYKSKIKGKSLLKISSYYPSSQLCNRCGYRNEKTKNLKIREWECPECSASHERDLNASLNILDKGLEEYLLELV